MERRLHAELSRLARGRARLLGGRWAGWWHLALLVAACVLAFVSRTLTPLPGLDWLEGKLLPTIFAAVALYLSYDLLRLLMGELGRGKLGVLAYQVDDRLEMHDQGGTAAEIDAVKTPLDGVLVERVTKQLHRVGPERLWSAGGKRLTYVRLALAIVFAFLLVGPGVDGLANDLGIGRGEQAGIGPRDGDPVEGLPRPMRADLWMAWFVEDPIPVESIAPEPKPKLPPAPGVNEADK